MVGNPKVKIELIPAKSAVNAEIIHIGDKKEPKKHGNRWISTYEIRLPADNHHILDLIIKENIIIAGEYLSSKWGYARCSTYRYRRIWCTDIDQDRASKLACVMAHMSLQRLHIPTSTSTNK